MRKMKKLTRQELQTIHGNGIGDNCHMGGDSYNCQSDCQCAWGKACEMYDDGSPGQCIAVGGGGNPGGGGNTCIPPTICVEEPY
ncbi:hypothetical protein HX13_15495 [Chryseobacterium sp. P1-3]|uniref:Bacteriocin n=2 Tax=Chryseobacterium gallinarum TaxID=1324352 RepID=A0A0G3M3L1_CHRGL|nr:hypothetical protein OK18_08120 [Chryseobacterium gallinarum]KFF73949.1 hypothetical protein HX13_15495 [Chryseobacterium sp. P1-3]